MGLVDDLKKEARASKVPDCQVGLALQALKPARRAEYVEAMREQSITHSIIAAHLSKEPAVIEGGWSVEGSFSRHRRKLCYCKEMKPDTVP